MEKCTNSLVAMFLSIISIFVYILPYCAPCSLADSISNSSMIINGSISGLPSNIPPVMLFIVNNNNPDQFIPVPGLSSSNNFFSVEVPSMMLSPNDGDVIGFKINGKDTGTTVIYHPGTVAEVQLHYTPPGSGGVIVVPVTPTPVTTPSPATPSVLASDNVTATPTSTTLPTSVVTNTATPSPISSPPAPSAVPAGATTVEPIIYASVVGVFAIAALIICLKRL